MKLHVAPEQDLSVIDGAVPVLVSTVAPLTAAQLSVTVPPLTL